MPIDFTCPHCRHRTIVDDQFAGRSGPCSQCQQPIVIPVPGQILGNQVDPLTGNQAGGLGPSYPNPNSNPTTAGNPGSGPNPYAAPIGQQQYPYPQHPGAPPQSDAAMRMLLPVDRSGLSIAAGYFGLVSVICLPAPIALVLGILAVRDIKKNPQKHGLGRAWFGIVMGGIFTAILLFYLVAMVYGVATGKI